MKHLNCFSALAFMLSSVVLSAVNYEDCCAPQHNTSNCSAMFHDLKSGPKRCFVVERMSLHSQRGKGCPNIFQDSQLHKISGIDFRSVQPYIRKCQWDEQDGEGSGCGEDVKVEIALNITFQMKKPIINAVRLKGFHFQAVVRSGQLKGEVLCFYYIMEGKVTDDDLKDKSLYMDYFRGFEPGSTVQLMIAPMPNEEDLLLNYADTKVYHVPDCQDLGLEAADNNFCDKSEGSDDWTPEIHISGKDGLVFITFSIIPDAFVFYTITLVNGSSYVASKDVESIPENWLQVAENGKTKTYMTYKFVNISDGSYGAEITPGPDENCKGAWCTTFLKKFKIPSSCAVNNLFQSHLSFESDLSQWKPCKIVVETGVNWVNLRFSVLNHTFEYYYIVLSTNEKVLYDEVDISNEKENWIVFEVDGQKVYGIESNFTNVSSGNYTLSIVPFPADVCGPEQKCYVSRESVFIPQQRDSPGTELPQQKQTTKKDIFSDPIYITITGIAGLLVVLTVISIVLSSLKCWLAISRNHHVRAMSQDPGSEVPSYRRTEAWVKALSRYIGRPLASEATAPSVGYGDFSMGDVDRHIPEQESLLDQRYSQSTSESVVSMVVV